MVFPVQSFLLSMFNGWKAILFPWGNVWNNIYVLLTPVEGPPARGFTNYTFASLPLCLCISIFCCCWMQATHIGWNYKGNTLNILVHIQVSGLRQYLMISSSLNPPANAGDIGDVGLILGLGRSPGGGHGHPLQCSCLENPTDRRVWWVTVRGVTKSQIQLK